MKLADLLALVGVEPEERARTQPGPRGGKTQAPAPVVGGRGGLVEPAPYVPPAPKPKAKPAVDLSKIPTHADDGREFTPEELAWMVRQQLLSE